MSLTVFDDFLEIGVTGFRFSSLRSVAEKLFSNHYSNLHKTSAVDLYSHNTSVVDSQDIVSWFGVVISWLVFVIGGRSHYINQPKIKTK